MNVFHAFSGVDSQLMAEKRVFKNVTLVGTMEVDIDAIISSGLIHHNERLQEELKKELNKDRIEFMKLWLKQRNIGYDFDKGKSKIDRLNVDKLNKLFLSCLLTRNYGDISLANKRKIDNDIDLFTYSSPCFLKGTLISTNKGLIPIENIKKGDIVLTHNNVYKEVVTHMINKANHIYEFNCMSSPILYVTEEHPFYVRERYRVWDKNKRVYIRKFKDPSWIKVKDLTKNYYVGTPINNIEKHIEWNGVYIKNKYGHNPILKNEISKYLKNEKFWWLVGRFIGDGWVDRWDIEQGGIKICSANTKNKNIIDIKNCLDELNISYSIENCKTVTKFNIHKQEYKSFFRQFGNGAENKVIPQQILDLPKNLLKSLLDGYWSADGFFDKKTNTFKATSVSKKLVLTLAQAIHKVYRRPTSVYKTKRKETCQIEGRIVNQKDSYNIVFKKIKNKQDKAFVDGDYIWSPIKNINKKEYFGDVYNFEVKDDNSYVAQNVIVHNCQSFSVAGKQEGLQGVSGLLLECEKFIEINKPKFLLLENVKNLVGKKFIKDFENWLKILDELGYNSYWKVLNAKDYGTPQNRERVFCLSIRKDIDKGFEFPNSLPLTKRLKDLLDDNVDSKYYLKDVGKFFINNLFAMEQKGNGFRFSPHVHSNANITKCITTKAGSRMDDNFIIDINSNLENFEFSSKNEDLKSIRLFGLFDTNKSKHQAGSVWDKDGLAPTLDTMQGGYRMPLIVEDTDKIIKVDIQQQVEVRKHNINQNELYEFLKSHKNKTNQEIANELNIPKTKVDHWFRNDESFAIPTRDIWFDLKKVLNINSDKFDKAIMEFEIKDGVYEKSNRCYLPQGIAPTLTTQCEEKIIDYENFHIRKLTPRECWRLMNFDEDAFDKVKDHISDTQLYKQSGNAIVCSCLEHIFISLKNQYEEECK